MNRESETVAPFPPPLGRGDLPALTACLLIILLFFLPMLMEWEGIFFDDIAFFFYPQQRFITRSLAQGQIPWWDPHTCAGGKPFFAQLFQGSLYPVQWVFNLLAHRDPARDYLWLVKAPLLLHYLVAAGLAFAFARRGLGLNRVGSAVFSLAYSFSPSMMYMSTDPPEIFIQAGLPLFCLCLIGFSREGGYEWVLLGALSFALVSPAGDVPFVFQMVLITGLFALGWAILQMIQGRRRETVRAILGAPTIFGLGALLGGLYWANMLEGLRMIASSASEVMESLTGFEQSLHPLYLITLFIPDFFGGVTSLHTWGAAFSTNATLNDANLLGGLVSSLLVVLGVAGLCRRDKEGGGEQDIRKIAWVFLVLLGVSLFVVMGPYTPVYRLLQVVAPVFRLPYPIRFRIIQGFSMAVLMGVSAHLLWLGPPGKYRRLVIIYLSTVTALASLALLWPYQFQEIYFVPGFRHLVHLNDQLWFQRGPLLYALLLGLLLAPGAILLTARSYLRLVTALAVAECLFFAYQGFYHNQVLNRRQKDLLAVRYRGPAEHPVYRTVGEWQLASDASPGYRHGHFRSTFDNLSWENGTLSILGFDTKPLDARFERVISRLAPGIPYELRPREWGSRFWSNLSVRDILLDREIASPEMILSGRAGDYFAYRRKEVLPRFYFQDRWTAADDELARRALLEHDLRDRGYLEPGEWNEHSAGIMVSAPPLADYPAHFERLQKDNGITLLDPAGPNKVTLKVEVSRPAMLVLTDVWHRDWRVRIDGKEGALFRVNYLQRGVWLRPGDRLVEMRFVPSSLRLGLVLTAAGVMGLLILAVAAVKRRPGMGRRINSQRLAVGRGKDPEHSEKILGAP